MSFKRFEKLPGVADPKAQKRKAKPVDYDDIFAQLEKDVAQIEKAGPAKKKVKKEPPKAAPDKPKTKEEQAKEAYYKKFLSEFKKVHKKKFKRTGASSFSDSDDGKEE